MRFGRASLALAFLAVVGLCVAGTASSAGTQPVTATTVTVTGATCSTPVQKGNVTVQHCTDGKETWIGDITGNGTYSYDRIKNLTTGVRVVVNASKRSKTPVFLVRAEGACTRDGTRMT